MTSKSDIDTGDAGHGAVAVSHASNENKMSKARTASILLRIAAAALCLIALVVMVKDKQTKNFVIPITPPITVSRMVKFSDAKVAVFFVWANGIVAVYLLIHALLSLCLIRKSGFNYNRGRLWLTYLIDMLMTYFLLSAAASTTDIAYLAKHGNQPAGWSATCTIFGKFCNQFGAAVLCSFIAVADLIALSILSAYQLFASDSQYGGGRNAGNKNFAGRAGP